MSIHGSPVSQLAPADRCARCWAKMHTVQMKLWFRSSTAGNEHLHMLRCKLDCSNDHVIHVLAIMPCVRSSHRGITIFDIEGGCYTTRTATAQHEQHAMLTSAALEGAAAIRVV